ncbi:hypothetical protein AB1Y20_008344 [Prymnesium parvum]|uniref:Anoctamin transmembrane domain-containing protein n=1 Tax=Prymnesium parvum TaxID=97485 RepID=A0AB34IV77_PRYPA
MSGEERGAAVSVESVGKSAKLGLPCGRTVAEKRKAKKKPRAPEEKAELMAEEAMFAGITADVIFTYPLPSADGEEKQEVVARRVETVLAMRAVGLVVIKHVAPDGVTMLLKVSARLPRLLQEAEQLGIEMAVKHEPGELPSYRDFSIAEKANFALKKDAYGWRLFSSLERQRLVLSICEEPRWRGGAELDLDALINDEVFSTYMPVHTAEGDELYRRWASPCALRVYPCREQTGRRARLFPDCGLLAQPLSEVRDYFGEKIAFYFAWLEHYTQLLFALAWLGAVAYALQGGGGGEESCYAQYEGAGQAFWCGVPAVGSVFEARRTGVPADNRSSAAEEEGEVAQYTVLVFSVVVVGWTSLYVETWTRRQNALAHAWDVMDFQEEEQPRPEFLRSYATGRYAAKEKGGSGAMSKRRGFYADASHFVADEEDDEVLVFSRAAHRRVLAWGLPLLATVFVTMVIGMLTIMAVRMIMITSAELKDDKWFGPQNATNWGTALNLVWMMLMNNVYLALAGWINNLENHRTDSEYENQLIYKSMCFQFVNSYFALFYIAFLKGARSISIWDSFGFVNPATREFYKDTCGDKGTQPWSNVLPGCDSSTQAAFDAGLADGSCFTVTVRSDCVDELQLQMFSYAIVKPAVGIALQTFLPMLTGCLKRFVLKRRIRQREKLARKQGKTTRAAVEVSRARSSSAEVRSRQQEEALEKQRQFDLEVCSQMAEPSFAGTFGEYNDKVVQLGYVCLFSGTYPLAPLIYACYNSIEVRTDAQKISRSMRRPRYVGAENIGTWYSVIKLLTWLAIPVNAFLMCFTDLSIRDYLFVPWTATESCRNTTDVSLQTPYARWYGYNTSWEADCSENFKMCFEELGAVEWLPGVDYLFPNSTTTLDFTEFGVCNPSSPLHNDYFCHLCRERVYRVASTRYVSVLVIVGSFVLLKLFLNAAIPDMPTNVRDHIAKQALLVRKLDEEKQKAAQGGPGSALKLAKLLETHSHPQESLLKYTRRTINMDDNDLPPPLEGETVPIDPRDQEWQEDLVSESWM